MSPFRGLRSTSLRHDDDGADIGPSSRLGNAYSIDDRARFFNQPPEHVVRSFLKAHDNPTADENPLSRVDQDRWASMRLRRDSVRVAAGHTCEEMPNACDIAGIPTISTGFR